jgi:glycerol-3-phosphate dehydrogenase
VFAGIRPLVRAGDAANTAALSRDHTVHIDRSGLLTIAGGKWTTYRNMAEDCVNQAATLAELDERPCITRTLNIHGYHQNAEKFGRAVALRIRCAGHSESRPQRSGARRTAPSRSAVHGC